MAPDPAQGAHLDTGHVLGETLILLADLKGQLPRVAHDQDRHLWGGQDTLTQSGVLNPPWPEPTLLLSSLDSPHPPDPHLRVHTTCSPHLGHEKAQSKRLSQPFTHLTPCILSELQRPVSQHWDPVRTGGWCSAAWPAGGPVLSLLSSGPGLPAHTTTHCNHIATSHSTTLLNHLLY